MEKKIIQIICSKPASEALMVLLAKLRALGAKKLSREILIADGDLNEDSQPSKIAWGSEGKDHIYKVEKSDFFTKMVERKDEVEEVIEDEEPVVEKEVVEEPKKDEKVEVVEEKVEEPVKEEIIDVELLNKKGESVVEEKPVEKVEEEVVEESVEPVVEKKVEEEAPVVEVLKDEEPVVEEKTEETEE